MALTKTSGKPCNMCMKENFSSFSEIPSYSGVIQIFVGIQDLFSVYTNLLMLHFVHMDLSWKGASCFPQSILWVKINKIIPFFHLKKFICAK